MLLCVSWLVVNSRDEVKKLAGMVVDHMRELVKAKAPIALNYRLDRVVADWEVGGDGVTRGAPVLVLAHAPKAYSLGALTAPPRSPTSILQRPRSVNL